jgi:hypothetical protein
VDGYSDNRAIAHELLFLAAHVLGGERRVKRQARQYCEKEWSKKSSDGPVGVCAAGGRSKSVGTAHDHPRRGGASLAFCNKRVKQNIGVVRVVHQHEKLKGKEESSGLRCNDGYESWAKAAARRRTAKRGGTDLKAGHYKCEGRRLRL